MKLYNRFLILSRGKQIALAVCSVHLLAIFGLTCHHFISRQLRPPRQMVVRTHRINEERSVPIVAAKQPVAENKQIPKPVAKVSKQGPAAKKAPRVLKDIANSFEVLKSEAKHSRPALKLPTVPTSSPVVTSAPTYGEFLITYLQSALDLPEYGEVRVKLEIDRFGRLIDCEILEAKSGKNGEFLKNQLPNLTFPCLNDFDIIEPSQTFTITFRNVEIH